MKDNLKAFEHFFVQNQTSKKILNKNNFFNCSIMGDSRFERVIELPKQIKEIEYLNEFKNSKKCLVAGSTWPEDEKIIIEFINSYKKNDTCFIIAPHQIDFNKINKTKSLINKETVLMSNLNKKSAKKCSVIIIDSIGLLNSVYNYADIGYVGGGMGKTGLHNTLEPAVFKIPVIIGKNFDKFPEVSELVNLKGFISIKNARSFKSQMNFLLENNKIRKEMGQINYNYINKNLGATKKVMSYLKQKK
jgi:3-deoxy-D-manno-octulosonic-acid transferase